MRYVVASEAAEIIADRLGMHIADLVDIFAEIPSADVVPRETNKDKQ